eukprot:gene16591-5081_t
MGSASFKGVFRDDAQLSAPLPIPHCCGALEIVTESFRLATIRITSTIADVWTISHPTFRDAFEMMPEEIREKVVAYALGKRQETLALTHPPSIDMVKTSPIFREWPFHRRQLCLQQLKALVAQK